MKFSESFLDSFSRFINKNHAERKMVLSQFNAQHYRVTYPDVTGDDRRLFDHYMKYGWREGRSPTPTFDPGYYLDHNPDVRAAGVEPFTHYLKWGKAEGRSGSSLRQDGYTFDGVGIPVEWGCKCSIISVIYKKYDRFEEYVAALNAQTYRNFELVLVCNGGHVPDMSGARFAYKIVESENTGFADANNVALEHCDGEIIVLLNDDTRASESWLYYLVAGMIGDDRIAATAPKILFMEPFIRLRIHTNKDIRIRKHSLGKSLKYNKSFLKNCHSTTKHIHVSGGEFAEIFVPLQESYSFDFENLAEDDNRLRIEHVGNSYNTLPHTSAGDSIHFELNPHMASSAFYVVNNAGSGEREDGTIYDRGLGEHDYGAFENPEYISHLCGCSFAIKRSALKDLNIFNSVYFTYFEDTSLSEYIRSSGYKIKYVPHSIVYHQHSATTEEHSAFWQTFVNRNRMIHTIETSRRANSKKININNLLNDYKAEQKHVYEYIRENYEKDENVSSANVGFTVNVPEILSQIEGVIHDEKLLELGEQRRFIKIGLLNDHWNTYGGGEGRALQIASYVKDIAKVELVSRYEFDLNKVTEFFGYDTSDFSKRVVSSRANMTSISEEYDIFINSSFGSKIVNKARIPLYLVSFPDFDPQADEEFFDQKFICNSKYTYDWCRNYWRRIASENIAVVYPDPSVPEPVVPHAKENVILSVGRFTTSGHVKNQHLMVDAFLQLPEDIRKSWKLVLVGSVDESLAENRNYFEKLKERTAGENIELFGNATVDVVRDCYSCAAIYWHMSGIGENVNIRPERSEHFGIAVLDAVVSGCYSVVYGGAGPEEIVHLSNAGSVISSLEELVEETTRVVNDRLYESIARTSAFSQDMRRDVFWKLVGEDIKALEQDRGLIAEGHNRLFEMNRRLLENLRTKTAGLSG